MEAIQYRGRLAPSPTGFLHPGHLSTFHVAAQRCAESKGTLVFRMEDLDRARCKPEFDAACMEDLRPFFDWQEGPDVGGAFQPYRQSERHARSTYLHYWTLLRDRGWIYPCSQSRRKIRASQQSLNIVSGPGGEIPFPVSLRGDTEQARMYDTPGLQAFRFCVPNETIEFQDINIGKVSYRAGEDFGDFLIWSVEGYPSYEFAVVVDDFLMRITEVVRGQDLLLSTARQILIYRALDLPIPAFYHCPLLLNSSGERLSKRKGSATIRGLQEDGWSKESILRGCNSQSPDPALIQAISRD